MKYSSLVIRVEKDVSLGDLLAEAGAEAKKRHGMKHGKVKVYEMLYVPKLNVYVAVYKTPDVR